MGTKLNVSQQRVLMAKKPNSFMLDCIGNCQQAEGGDPLVQLSTSETHLGCWVQVCALQNKRDTEIVECVQNRTIKVIKGLEHLSVRRG